MKFFYHKIWSYYNPHTGVGDQLEYAFCGHFRKQKIIK